MKLTRYTPNSGLTRVTDFDEWFRNPFAGFPTLGRLFDWESALGGSVSGHLATDIHEDKDNYYATFEVPGVKKEDVKVELNDRMLTVTVERKEKQGDSEASYSATRSISVPDGVNAEAISARVEDGILTVSLPKNEERKPRTIEIA